MKPTSVLLVESNPAAREHHTEVLRQVGYGVVAERGWSSLPPIQAVAAILCDVVSFDRLAAADRLPRLPPVIVIADGPRAGVAACLRGAAAWVPIETADAYLLDTAR